MKSSFFSLIFVFSTIWSYLVTLYNELHSFRSFIFLCYLKYAPLDCSCFIYWFEKSF